jgi:hypothetical protein
MNAIPGVQHIADKLGPLGGILAALNASIQGVTDFINSFRDLQNAKEEYENAVNERDRAYAMTLFALQKCCQNDPNCCKNSNNCCTGPSCDNNVPLPPDRTFPGGSGNASGVGSRDPNIKVTVGYGIEGYISPDTPIFYTIEFENQPSATAPAQKVVITDQLEANLEWSTVELISIGFNGIELLIPPGLNQYEDTTSVGPDPNPVRVRASMNPDTGVFTWTMESVDPVSGELPEDPFAGFLPPNRPECNHCGEGHVTFLVWPRTGLTSGNTITNQASIVFDVNQPISTGQVVNTIDNLGPVSTVGSLPSITGNPNLFVSWSGSDNTGGSGVAFYDVYVAIDNGAFTRWLVGTVQTSATYSGAPRHAYRFYSVATDYLGNREAAPTEAQASTTVSVCAHTLSPGGQGFSFDQGANSLWVSVTPGDCVWTATTSEPWIAILSGSGTGNGTVDYSVSGNGTGQSRKGTITIGGQPFTVRQAESEFTDVPADHWARGFIYSMYVEGITGGCGGGDYCPDNPVTRAQMAVFIEAALGVSPVPSCNGTVFDDVNEASVGAAFCGFIEDFAARGITGGCGGGNYCPDDPVTRGQMAVFMEAALGVSPVPSCNGTVFDDVNEASAGAAFCGFIEDFAARGITGGCGGGNYCPVNPVTRGQMAVFISTAFLEM